MTPHDWARVDELFQAAVAVAPSERERLIDAAAVDDAGTAQEVRELLAAHDAAAGTFLEPVGTASPREAWLESGQRVGAYRVVRQIGRGGMGAVYLGERDDGQFAQTVAIKVMRATAIDQEATRRFESERRILAALQHAGIVSLFDGGSTPTGQPYLVTEFVDGESITSAARARLMPLVDRLRLFRQVCDGVHHAHQRSVVHRDLKPANVLLTAGNTVKILDFGVAKLLGPDGPDLTRDGPAAVPLTLNYASPEQLRGLPVTTASDIYSLGVLLYELIAGVRPRELEGRPFDEVLHDVIEQPTPKPSVRAGASMPYPAATLRGDLDAIVLKAMRVEPAARYASADELSRDVGRVLNGDPITARAPSLGYLTGRLVRRHRIAAVIAGVAAVSVLAALVVALFQYRRAVASQAVAEARFGDVRALANGLIFRLDDAVRTKSPTEARQLIVSDALQYLDKLAATSPDVTLQLELALGYRRIAQIQGVNNAANLGDRKGALESAGKSAMILEGLAPGAANREDVLESLVATYRMLADLVPRADSLTMAKAALTAAEQRVALNRNDGARIALASAYFSLASRSTGAERRTNFEAAGREFEVLLAEKPDDVARMRNVALVDKYLVELLVDQPAEKLRRGERAATLDEKRLALEPNNRQTLLDAAISFSQLALAKSDERERLALLERSLAIRERVVALDPADEFARTVLRRAVAMVGRSQFRLQRREDARRSAQRVLSMFETKATIEDSEVVWRGWGHLILASDAAAPGACTHLRRAVIDLRRFVLEFPDERAGVQRVRALLPRCAIDDRDLQVAPG